MSLHLLGASRASRVMSNVRVGDGAGDLYGSIFKGAGELLSQGVNAYQSSQAADTASADAQGKLAAAIAADAAAAQAVATALTSAAAGLVAPKARKASALAKAEADDAAAQAALAAEDDAVAALPASVSAARVTAARNALASASKTLQQRPTDTLAQNLVKAWVKVLTKGQASEIVKKGSADVLPAQPSWFVRPVLGPVPGWGVLAGGTGLLAIAGVVLKRLVFR